MDPLQENLGLTRLFDKLGSEPMLAAATASYNTAAGHAVQINGPVADSIQYMYDTSVATHFCVKTLPCLMLPNTRGEMDGLTWITVVATSIFISAESARPSILDVHARPVQ